MSLAERADLVARLSLDDKFSGSLKKAQKNLGFFGHAAATAVGQGIERAAERGARAIVGQVTSGIDSLASLEDATTSVDGAISQLGLTGKVTSGQIAQWANEIESNVQAAFDDKDITQATTTLIRYGKIVPANIRPAMEVMTDLAAKTGDVGSASTLLARALADPEKAAGKLARVGVVLTKQQQDQIKAMVKAGKTADAQAYLLDALATSTKGAAAAMHGPFRDSQLVLQDVVEDAQRALATGFLPVLEEVRTELSQELAKPQTLARIKEFGKSLAGGLKGLIGLIKGLDWNAIGSSLKLAGDGAHAIYDAFTGMPDWIKAAVLTGWGLNKVTGGGLGDLVGQGIKITFGQFFQRGASPANPMWVATTGGLGGGGAGGAVAGGSKAAFLGAVAAGAIIIPEVLGAVQDKIITPRLQEQAGKNIQATQGVIDTGNQTAQANALQQIRDNVSSLSGIQKVLYDLNANGVKTHTEGLEAALVAAIQESSKANTTNLQPLPDKITKKQEHKFDTLRDKLESTRISTVTRLGGVQSEFARGSQAIVNAIRANRPVVHVNVTSSLTRITYATGGTLSRYSGKLVPES